MKVVVVVEVKLEELGLGVFLPGTPGFIGDGGNNTVGTVEEALGGGGVTVVMIIGDIDPPLL